MLFMGAPPESEKIAKKKLLCYLRREEDKEEPAPAGKNKWWQFKNKYIEGEQKYWTSAQTLY